MDKKKKLALQIIQRLRDNGYTAYLAGGCVRDIIMQREPFDYDIAADAPVEKVASLFEKTVKVGAAFGVTLVIIDNVPFEVAVFRSEGPYLDGRHPSTVTAADPEIDALRRDFTINGLFYDPANDAIIDYVGGQEDICRQCVRTIGDPHERFDEDKLRMLRAIRFSSVLGFTLDEGTLRAIIERAREITVVSSERVRDELIKMFTLPHADKALELLDASGLLAVLLPEVAAMKGVAQPAQFHPEGDVFEHTKIMMGMLDDPSVVLAFSCLFHDTGKVTTYEESDRIRFNEHDRVSGELALDICQRLRFSNNDTQAIVDCVAGHMRFMHAKEMRPRRREKLMSRATFADELALHRFDCAASHGDLSIWEFLKEEYAEFLRQPPPLDPLIKGDDLIGLGYKPGVQMGQILRAVEELRLEEKLNTKEDALSWVRETFPLDA